MRQTSLINFKDNKPWLRINGLWLVYWYLICVLDWLTKTGTKYKSNQEASNQRTLRLMNQVKVHKVEQSSEGWT